MRLLAQVLKLPDGTVISGPQGYEAGTTLGAVISKLIPFLMVFAGVGLLVMLILGGFTLLTGATDPKQIEGGKQKITYAVVGFILIFLAYWLVQLIALIFGLTEFQNMFPLK